MYETLFEIILWFIFVRRKGKVTSLNFIQCALLFNTLNALNAPLSSAFQHNNTLIDNNIDRSPFPELQQLSKTSSNEDNDTTSQQELPMAQSLFRHSFFVSAIYIVAYSVVFIIGLVGNCVVMIVVIRSSRMRNATNFFICNLAFADTLVIVCCLPATLLGHLLTPWILGFVLCKLVSYLQGVAVSASINTLVAVSIERYLAICYPFKRPMSRSEARKWIFIIWAISLSIAMPWAFYFKTISYKQQYMACQSASERNTTTNSDSASIESIATAQLLLQDYEQIHLGAEVLNYQFTDQAVYNQTSNQVNNQNTKQRIASSHDENCEFKRKVELNILDRIHRLVLKLKLHYLHQIMQHDDVLRIIKKNGSIFIGELLFQLNHLDNSLTSDQKNLLPNFEQLNQLISQLDTVSCECLEKIEIFSETTIDERLIVHKLISDHLNLVLKYSLNEQYAFQQSDKNGVERSLHQANRKLVKNSLINSAYNGSETRLSLKQLNRLETNLFKQIKLRTTDPLPRLSSSGCTLGCDLLDSSMCALHFLSTNQTNFLSNERNDIRLRSKRVTNDNHQLNNQRIAHKQRLERSIDNESLVSELPLSTIPSLKNNNSDVEQFNDFETCSEQWPDPLLEKYYFIGANLILGYLLPLIVISACYIAIWITVWTRSVPCETTSDTVNNTPTLELPHHSCRINYARKPLDQQSTASSRSTKSLLINTFSGLRNNLFPASANLE